MGPGVLLLAAGCMVSSSKFETVESQNRVLSQQNQAQLAEIDSLKTHSRHVEDQLASTEEKAAVLEEQLGLNRQQLANYRRETDTLHTQVQGLADDHLPAAPEGNRRLAALARRCRALHYDPSSGVARLDSDILFDTGRVELKSGATQALAELAQALNAPEARDLKVFVVGHTDDRPIAHLPARDLYAGNFDLSTARAQNVAEFLRKQGLAEARLGVAASGPTSRWPPTSRPTTGRRTAAWRSS